MDFAHGTTVLVRSVVTTTDDVGDSTTVVTETPWGPCAIAPRTEYAATSERTDPHSPAVIIGLTVYGPTIALDADDLLVIDGEEYQVEGRPGVWRSPFTGWAPGLEVAVKRASAQ